LKFEPEPPAVAADTPYATIGGMVSVSRERSGRSRRTT
jgi:hypothetical protein